RARTSCSSSHWEEIDTTVVVLHSSLAIVTVGLAYSIRSLQEGCLERDRRRGACHVCLVLRAQGHLGNHSTIPIDASISRPARRCHCLDWTLPRRGASTARIV